MEAEYFVQLLVKPDVPLPTVGELLERKFKEQKLCFMKVCVDVKHFF